MKVSPGDKLVHSIACKQLDVFATHNAPALLLTHEIMLCVSNMIRDQQMKMNGPAYNSQQYTLWKLIDAGIDAVGPGNVSRELYEALQTSFSVTFLLRTLVFFTSAEKVACPGEQTREISETIHRVCRLIRFRIQYESDNGGAHAILQRFLDTNGISVLIDTIHHQSEGVAQKVEISTVFACVNILLHVFGRNDGAQDKYLLEPCVGRTRPLMQFAFGRHESDRNTTTLPQFIAANFAFTKLRMDDLCDPMYIRGIRDTIALLWGFSEGGGLLCQAMVNDMNRTAAQLGIAFEKWNLDMAQTNSRVTQQDDIMAVLGEIVWRFDEVWIRTLQFADRTYVFNLYNKHALSKYIQATQRFRLSQQDTPALMQELETRASSMN